MRKIILLRNPVSIWNVCDIRQYTKSKDALTHYYTALIDENTLVDDYTHKERRVHENDIFGIYDEFDKNGESIIELARAYNKKLFDLYQKLEQDKKDLINEFDSLANPNY